MQSILDHKLALLSRFGASARMAASLDFQGSRPVQPGLVTSSLLTSSLCSPGGPVDRCGVGHDPAPSPRGCEGPLPVPTVGSGG